MSGSGMDAAGDCHRIESLERHRRSADADPFDGLAAGKGEKSGQDGGPENLGARNDGRRRAWTGACIGMEARERRVNGRIADREVKGRGDW